MSRPIELWQVRGYFRYRCPACEAEYDRRFVEAVEVFVDPPPTDARLAKYVLDDTDGTRNPGPCPQCGRRPPRDAVKQQFWWDLFTATAAPIAFCLAMAYFLVSRTHLYWAFTVALAAVPLLALVGSLILGRVYPIGLPASDADRKPRPGRLPANLLLVLAAGVLLVPPTARLVGRIPLNDYCVPLVVQPGQTVRVIVDQSRSSFQGDWGGVVWATLDNAPELGVDEPIVATTRELERADVIQPSKNEGAGTVNAYADIQIPDRPDLVGKTLDLRITLVIDYPAPAGAGRFRYETAELSATRPVTVSSATVAARDKWTHYASWAVGIGLMALAAGWLLVVNPARARRWDQRPEVILS